MSQHEAMSVASRATPLQQHRTPKKHHSSRHEADVPPPQRFRVNYQKVSLDVDLERQFLTGQTEITVSPLDDTLRVIKLDCRGIQINSVVVNERRAQYTYDDFQQNEEYMNDPTNPILRGYKYDAHFDSNSANIEINQHHLLRSKYFPLFSDQSNTDEPEQAVTMCTSELSIRIPDSIKIRAQTTTSKHSPHVTKSTAGTPMTAATERIYTPLTIKISYMVKNSRNGIIFHGGKLSNIPKNRWYCYTQNNDFGCSASSWVPCIDNLYEKPAWDINVIVPKTLDHVGTPAATQQEEKTQKSLPEDNTESTVKPVEGELAANDEEDDDEDDEDDERADDDDDDDADPDSTTQIVVAVPDSVHSTEIPHDTDPTKKIVNFQFFIPVCAHHLGFAVGPFEKTPMLELKPGTDDLTTAVAQTVPVSALDDNEVATLDAAAASRTSTHFYFLPGQRENVLNSTAFLYKVFDFFSKEFSSYPFSSYSIVFLDDFSSQPCSFAGMTIASTDLLYSADRIEPAFSTTEILTCALADQYSGVNVLPKTLNDIWCVIGIARFMALMFLKKLFGGNYHKFNMKKRTELLCEIDISQRPLSNQAFRFPMNADQDLELIKIKSPLVLAMLDKRMTKTDKSFGLYRVIPKIFVQALSNDLPNGNCLSTEHFQKLCEKVAHNRLDAFFQNWIHHPGVPVFRVIQKFNKKRMFIEMSISQMQRSAFNKNSLSNDERDMMLGSSSGGLVQQYKFQHFVDDANWQITETDDYDPQHVFVGPVTVRIHETDGSPYEHVMNINNPHSKMDIQYNTKYRRRKKKDGTTDEIQEEDEKEKEKEKKKKQKDKEKEEEEPKINKFGDLLMTSTEIQNWGLREDEVQVGEDVELDAFEWMRFDADSEWICDRTINLSDQMFESQLRQDRDVEAHYEAVRHFASQLHPSVHSAKVLLRTLLDKRYYYGIRVEAVRALATMSKVENDHIGMRYLLRAFKYLFCYSNKIKISEYDELNWREYIPKTNQFSDFRNMFLQKAFVNAFMIIKNKDGDAPIEIKKIVLGLLKYNDNDGNEFDDCYYLCDLIRAVATHVIISNRYIDNVHALAASADTEGQDVLNSVTTDKDQFVTDAIHELNRCEKVDRWTSSYKQMVTKTVLEQRIRFARAGLSKITFYDLLPYTQSNYDDTVKLVAFEGLLLLGGLRNRKILSYYFLTMTMDDSNYLKYELNKKLVYIIGVAALTGTGIGIDDQEFLPDVDAQEGKGGDVIKVGDGASNTTSFRLTSDEHAKKTVKNAIESIRESLAIGKGLQKNLWEGIHSCMLSVNAKRNMFDIATVLFEAKDFFRVVINRPMNKKLVVKIQAKFVPALQKPRGISAKDRTVVKEIEGSKGSVGGTPSVTDLSKEPGLVTAPMESIEQSAAVEPVDSEEKATFVITIKRESRFKIQLPTFKLKALHNERRNVGGKTHGRKPSSLANISSGRSSLDLHASTSTHQVSRSLGLVKVFRTGDEHRIQMRVNASKLRAILVNRRVMRKIMRNDPAQPLRYVRLNVVKKTVELCTDDRFGGLRNILSSRRHDEPLAASVIPISERHVQMVTLKINPDKWKQRLVQKQKATMLDKNTDSAPGTTKPMIRPQSIVSNATPTAVEPTEGITAPMMAPTTGITTQAMAPTSGVTAPVMAPAGGVTAPVMAPPSAAAATSSATAPVTAPVSKPVATPEETSEMPSQPKPVEAPSNTGSLEAVAPAVDAPSPVEATAPFVPAADDPPAVPAKESIAVKTEAPEPSASSTPSISIKLEPANNGARKMPRIILKPPKK